MSDERVGQHLKNVDKLTGTKSIYRKEMEAPVTRFLTPEAREDAMKVAKEIWIKSMRLLGDKDKDVRRDFKDEPLFLEGKKKLENTWFRGADLGIDRYHFKYDGKVITHSRQELYIFYLDHVVKITRNMQYINEGKNSRGLTIEEHEANRDELINLLDVVQNSTQFKQEVIKTD
ncbi:MAG: hypothetical protein Q7R31_01250 [Candidatus Levybacteria bacterium]|nr:hypothetical protein [Candidatus Levybacteria bacterium]